MEDMRINSELDLPMYSVRDLAAMHLPGYPDTERAWLDRAKNGNWDFKEVVGRGRGGIKRLYLPPPEIVTLIEERQRQNDLDFLCGEFKKFTDGRTPEPFAVSTANFVDLYNNYGEDFACFPERLRRRIPKLELHEFQNWIANKEHKSEEGYTTGKTVTLPLHPSLAEKIGMALFEVYGAAGYGALDEKIKIGVYGALYSAFCQIGASETAVPSIEEVKTVIELAIKYGKAPAPAK